MRRLLIPTTAVLLPAIALAQGDEAYRKSVDSVARIVAFDKEWEPSLGSGVVVDADKGYVLTAYHVVGADRLVMLHLPIRGKDGEVVTDLPAYTDAFLKCLVVARDARRDLALLKIKAGEIKEGAPPLKALPLAARSVPPGAAVFTIGGDWRCLWRFAGGHVRQVYQERWAFEDGQAVEARVIAMTVPLNPGDSGGPIIDRRGDLVGINSAVVKDANQMQKGIDVAEIRAFLEEHHVLGKPAG